MHLHQPLYGHQFIGGTLRMKVDVHSGSESEMSNIFGTRYADDTDASRRMGLISGEC